MRWGLVCVVLLAVTAGCNSLGAGGPETATPTVTPAPVPAETATESTTPVVAPGVATTGITDLDRLTDSHVRAARNESWVFHERSRITQSYGNVTVNTTRNQSVRFVDPATYYHSSSTRSIRVGQQLQFLQDYERYADGSVAYETWYSPAESQTVYHRDDSPAVTEEFPGFATDRIGDYLALESATVSRVDVGEREHFLVVGMRSSVPDYGPVDTYRARAVVREDGFVRSLNVTYTVEEEDILIEGSYNFTYTQVGNATVERPDWVATAETRTAP